ncbi:MAG: VOC family protein [Hyphomicrobiaceae bacterium]|nr:VOC family protein [Hyphomicrobiaceae bacterium]
MNAQFQRHNPNPLLIAPETRVGALHLRITSVERALPIWRDMIGLHVIDQTQSELVLGIGDQPLVHLHAGAERAVRPKSLGLYHIAIHVPARKEIARAVLRQLRAGVRTSPTDHLVSEATYLWDLDGNGIEMTFETPERGFIAYTEGSMQMVTADGKPHSGLEAIELDGLFAELSPDDDLMQPLPVGTRLGHIHVHVSDLEQSMRFYADTIGFQRQILSPRYGMGDVKTTFEPHILAFNVWSGPMAAQTDKSHAGLDHFELVVPNSGELDQLAGRLDAHQVPFAREGNGALLMKDPSANALKVRV